jgi:hypothetical protein
MRRGLLALRALIAAAGGLPGAPLDERFPLASPASPGDADAWPAPTAAAATELPCVAEAADPAAREAERTAARRVAAHLSAGPTSRATALAWLWVGGLGGLAGDEGAPERSRSWIDEWLLGKAIAAALQELGATEAEAGRGVDVVRLLTSHARWHEAPGSAPLLESLLADEAARRLLGVNRWQGVLWFRDEGFAEMLDWLLTAAAIDARARADERPAAAAADWQRAARFAERLRAAAEGAEYRVERLLRPS